ncbi:MAG: exodeoxyribonuclease VII large subunit [Planctomycetes bacterium]|nr:exodeoxyribonuclease VII large subunit [Planctomycetota bacterium]MCB9935295.1 exodeoxyribonuclease VII large subunit [Planctomycetota bacterium]
MMEAISVTEFSNRVKRCLEPQFSNVAVTGELSNYRGPHHSGHVYCNLKDSGAQVRLIIWRGTFERLKFKLTDGLEVTIIGKLDVYARRGEYSLVATSVQPKGVGGLQLAFQQMYERLEHEGLFDPGHKKPLPEYPQRIAVITSPTGAAIHDIITTAQRRNRLVEILVYPAKVQGEGAAEQVARAIRKLNALNASLGIDAMIVGRGGGSLEDLWAFNEEAVARAIFDSEIPVVSAVGHEVDTTIADLVADYRAPTPTAAAEILVPELAGMVELVTEYQLKLGRGLRHTLELWRGRLETMSERLAGLGPLNQLRREQQRLDYLLEGLKWSMHHRLKDRKEKLHALGAHLEALSPLKVLERGYSITRNAQGKVIKKASEVKAGDKIVSKLAEGTITSQVTGIST